MKKFFVVAFLLLAIQAGASHIVGGEFEIIHIGGNQYRVNLIYYFDVINNGFNGVTPEQMEPTITASIFQKSNNTFKRNVILSFVSRTPVDYTQPECSNDFIVTEKVLYSTVITMPDADYNNAAGYYIVWERCCRNYTITNIWSQPPVGNNSPNSAGQTFYLEFPPVVKNGQPFINSSPRLFPPLNDYACPYRPYYADFAGTDDDGDSLVYSLATPLSTHQTVAVPAIGPAPYPLVRWVEPFGVNNILAGEPDLKVSQDGFLTVKPTTLGLFVFAVKCEEFRDGIKIGEVQRDFQMFVVDGCAPAEPPMVESKPLTPATTFSAAENMVLTFASTVPDQERCIQVRISDSDSEKLSDNFTENVKIKAIPLNFRGTISNYVKMPPVISATLTNGSTKVFDICFAKCPPFEGPFQIGIVAYDDACALPLTDTLKIAVTIDGPPNSDPDFTTPNVNALINEGDKVTFPIMAGDLDNHPLLVNYLNDGFSLESVGMKLTTIQQTNGTYRAELEWDTRCNVYDFTGKSSFELKVLVEDQNLCPTIDLDTMVLKMQVKLPGNFSPEISTDLQSEESDSYVVTRKVFETLDFNIFGKDLIDKDTVILKGTGIGFEFETYQMLFPGDSSNVGNTQSPFLWTVNCDNVSLEEKNEFDFEFVVIDNKNKCRFLKADTLRVKVLVEPPDNQLPALSIVSTNPDLTINNNEMEITLGQQITLGLIANDPDVNPFQDEVLLDLTLADGTIAPSGYDFASAKGLGIAETTFSWNPDCSIFENGDYENEYFFTFATRDNRCFSEKGDTVTIKMTIRDVDGGDDEFLPPNFISPNGDETNEYFAMVALNDEGELVNIMPADNCIGHFESVSIFNRWGGELFTSRDRDFRWLPRNEAMGIYYYTLKFSNKKEYRGTITLRN
jgi:hypothetical protein